jgi:RNA polymerase sigma-70 factor (ECF subfamily)
VQRELLVLVELEGYSVPEVAESTQVDLNTLYTRLRAARARFAALLGASR